MSPAPGEIWRELGIEPTRNLRTIRRAYAQRLKQVHPEDDPTGFQRLRLAYERAQALAEGREERAVQAPPAQPAPGPPPSGVSRSPAVVGADLARRFLAASQAEPGSAPERLRQLLGSPLMQSLVIREQFEQQLLRELLRMPEPPEALVAACTQLFDWNDVRHPLQREGLHALLQRVSAARIERRLRQARRELAQIRAGNQGSRAQRRALLALLGPVQPLRFAFIALFQDNRDAIAHYLRELPALGGEFFGQETQAEAVAWWRNRLQLAHLGARRWLMLMLAGLIQGLLTVDRGADFMTAHPIWGSTRVVWALLAIGFWCALLALLALMALHLHRRWQHGYRRGYERWAAGLRHSRRGRLLLGGGILLLTGLTAMVPALGLRLPCAVGAYALLWIAFDRLALRMALSAVAWAVFADTTLESGFEDRGTFLAPHLLAIALSCAGMLVLHNRLVRRGLSIERIQFWVRSYVWVNWLLPLALFAGVMVR